MLVRVLFFFFALITLSQAIARGVNLAGLEFAESTWPGTININYAAPTKSEVDYFVGKGLDWIRLPFLWERIQPQKGGDFNPAYLGYVTDLVSYITAKGGHVILDPHNYARYYHQVIGASDVTSDDFARFWVKLSQVKEFQHPKVVYALMNEPKLMSTETWFRSAQSAINAIRAAGRTNLILVPGNGWTGAHSWLANGRYGTSNAQVMKDIKDPGNNFAFEVHQYLDSDSSGTNEYCSGRTVGSERMSAFTEWCRANKFKAFLGEFGGGRNDVCYSAIDDLMNYLDRNSDVYIGSTWWAAGPWWGDYIFALDPVNGVDRPQMRYLTPRSAPKPETSQPSSQDTPQPSSQNTPNKPKIVSLSVSGSCIPSTGSFPVSVRYLASGPSVLTVDILDSNGWKWLGSGTADVAVGGNVVTIRVVPSQPIPSVSTIVLKAWIVDVSQRGNWEAAVGEGAQNLAVTVGCSTQRPTQATPRPSQETPRPTQATPRPTQATPRPTQATPRPSQALSSGCAFHETSSSPYYQQVAAEPGVQVRMTCSSGSSNCVLANGWVVNGKQIWQCQPQAGESCQDFKFVCSNGNRESGPSSNGLAGWAIALIVLGVLAVALILVGATYYFAFRPNVERV